MKCPENYWCIAGEMTQFYFIYIYISGKDRETRYPLSIAMCCELCSGL